MCFSFNYYTLCIFNLIKKYVVRFVSVEINMRELLSSEIEKLLLL
jgi:hypothetical protein